jgi:hypothetical protein
LTPLTGTVAQTPRVSGFASPIRIVALRPTLPHRSQCCPPPQLENALYQAPPSPHPRGAAIAGPPPPSILNRRAPLFKRPVATERRFFPHDQILPPEDSHDLPPPPPLPCVRAGRPRRLHQQWNQADHRHHSPPYVSFTRAPPIFDSAHLSCFPLLHGVTGNLPNHR